NPHPTGYQLTDLSPWVPVSRVKDVGFVTLNGASATTYTFGHSPTAYAKDGYVHGGGTIGSFENIPDPIGLYIQVAATGCTVWLSSLTLKR
ncbi:MAG: hypothetical protein KAS32_16585, partial [Candidatus Peribacteraceae bacterium]|nr:hypothetical protein [Candidatus Peribacteraceae bacterium]